MSSASSVATPTEEALPTMRRFHLLFGRGVDRGPFESLVAPNGKVHASSGWLGVAESATRVSPVEADARLARWSKQTGRLAVRLTRTDPAHFWVAVHYEGRRSLALVHDDSPLVSLHAPRLKNAPVLLDSPFGRDPFFEQLVMAGEPLPSAAERVIGRRAAELAAALSQDDIEVEDYVLRRVLSQPSDAALVGVLEACRATPMLACLDDLRARSTFFGFGNEVTGVVARAVGLGIILPLAVATTAFLTLVTWLSNHGTAPALAFLGAMGASVIGLWATRTIARRTVLGRALRLRDGLAWADPAHGRPTVRPLPVVRDQWGGLFFLLRDIAFFGGIDRPSGPAAVYVDTWGVGPKALVESLNAASRGQDAPPAMYELAEGLVGLRDRLIAEHLGERQPDPDAVRREVQGLILRATR